MKANKTVPFKPSWGNTEIKEAVNLYVSNLVTSIGRETALKALKEELSYWE